MTNSLDRKGWVLSKHAVRRAARRNLVPDAVEYVLAHGRCLQRSGVTFYFLGRRDLPPADRQASWASRLEGTVVLMGCGGEVVTVYRNRNALPTIRRKMKYRLDTASFKTIGTAQNDRRSKTA